MVILLLVGGCAAHHYADPNGGYTDSVSTPAGTVREMDAETGSYAVQHASPAMPATYVHTTREGTTMVSYGNAYYASYGPSQGAGDAQAAWSLGYRERYRQQQAAGYGSPAESPRALSPFASTGSSMQEEAVCPRDRAPANDHERLACHELAINGLLDQVGTRKEVK